MNDGIKMQISAFVDGELTDNEAQLLLRRLSQDAALRQQAAEYLALGRAMRGELDLAGAGDLRSRVAAAVEDGALADAVDFVEPASGRYTRPLIGFAIAATVAVAAVFGLQQVSLQSPEDQAPVTAESRTVPEIYFQRHDEANSNLNTRLVISPAFNSEDEPGEYVEIEAPSDASEAENDLEPVEPEPVTP